MVVGHQYISPIMTCLRHVTLHFFVVQFLFIVCLAYSLPFAPSSQMAPASLSRLGRSPFLACRSELPPMCFFAMKMLGTVDWPVRSARADWIAEPSSTKRQSLLILQNYPTRTRATTLIAFTPRCEALVASVRTDLVQLNSIKLCALVAQQLLRLAAVGAV